jgi:hypothetical protein
MFMFTPETIKPHLESNHYEGFLGWELVGYVPCVSQDYYSIGTKSGQRVTPVFLGHDIIPYGKGTRQWSSDTEDQSGEWNRDHHWIMYFMGFESREAALEWLAAVPETSFDAILWDEQYGLSWHNS